MHEIKRYANGKLYDSTDKRYISIKEIEKLVKSGESFRVIVSRTGEDITESILDKVLKERAGKKEKEAQGKVEEAPVSIWFFGFTKSIRTWVGNQVEKRVKEILSRMNLVTKDQVADLSRRIENLTLKMAALERMEAERENSPEMVFPEKQV